MTGVRRRGRTALLAVALIATGLASVVVTAPPSGAADPGLFEPVEVASGGRGHRTGPAGEIGMEPFDLAARGDGTVLVADGSVIRLIDPVAGTNTVVAVTAGASGAPAAVQLGADVYLNGVAAGSDSSVYANVTTSIAPSYPGQLVELDLASSTGTPVAGGGTASWGDGQPALGTFLFPTAVTVAADGSVLFYTGTGTFGAGSIGPAIVSLDPVAGTLTRLVGGGSVGFESWEGASAFDINLSGLQVESIARTPDGSVHFTSVGRVWRADATTGLVDDLVPFTAGLPSGPRGLAVDGAGSLRTVTFAANGEATLVEVDPATGATEAIAVVPMSPTGSPRLGVAPDGAAFLLGRETPTSRRDHAVVRVTPAGAVTAVAGNGANDRWQGDGTPFSVAFFPPLISNLVPGPDGRIYTLRDGGLASYDPANGLTDSVVVPGLVTQWSVYAPYADVLGFAFDGRAIVRSIVPTGPIFGNYAIDLVDITAGTAERAYGPTTVPVLAAAGPGGNLYVVDSAAEATIRIDGAGGQTVIGNAPGEPTGLWATAAGGLFADFGGLHRLDGETWVPLEVCFGEYGDVESAFIHDGADRFVAGRTDSSGSYVGCQYDPATGTTTDIGPIPDGLPSGLVDAEGFSWFTSGNGLSKMLVRPAGAVAQQTLTVTRGGTGGGAVTSSPAGITCGITCSAAFAEGAVVTLTAAADPGSTFTGWAGACTGIGTCQVNMSEARSVAAAFTIAQQTLTVTRSGAGSGTVASNPSGITCGTTCSAAFAEGAVVTLTPAADPSSTFTGWSGACTGTGTCQVTMSEARSVSAAFTTAQWPLTVTKTGAGTVTSNPAGINCGTICTASYANATPVTLTASPGGNSTFAGWSGACTGTGTCQVTMSAARAVTANFAANPTANLRLTITQPTSAGTGNPFTISYVVTNLGPSAAGGATLAGTLDADIVMTGALPGGCSQPTGPASLACTIATTIPSGQSHTLTIPVRSVVVGSSCTVWGTSGNDVALTGTSSADEICGLGGNDTITGLGGDDLIHGDTPAGAVSFAVTTTGTISSPLPDPVASNDTATATTSVARTADGNDTISGGGGIDVAYGQGGDDTLRGGDDGDGLIGGLGSDTAYGDAGGDTLFGDEFGEDDGSGVGDRLLDGGPGQDFVSGQGGDDIVVGGAESDEAYGGEGHDTIYGDVVSATNVATGSADDIDGGAGADTIRSQGGNDVVYGGPGSDTAYGGNGDDMILGDNQSPSDDVTGDSDVLLDGGAGADDIYGHGGADVIVGGSGADVLWGDTGNDRVYGDVNDSNDVSTGPGDQLQGGPGNDRLYGQGGGDRLFGQKGDDIIVGGDGDDRLSGHDGEDTIDGGVGNDNLDGGEDDDTLDGAAGADFITGREGNDQISGGAGNDVLDGEVGDDIAAGGAGNDTVLGREGNDRLNGDDGTDIVDGDVGNDRIFGDAGTDWLYGGDGVDTLGGGSSNDVLDGGSVPGSIRNDLDGGPGYDCAERRPDNLRNIEQVNRCAPQP